MFDNMGINQNTMKWKKIGLGVTIILTLLLSGFFLWAAFPLGPSETALAALKSTPTVDVNQGEFITFSPSNADPSIGLIFYPGGHVDERSYAPLAQQIAEQGYFVVIVPMFLDLAVLSPNRASEVINNFNTITTWAIAGHSLGGSMAAAFVSDNPNQVLAIYLLASYTTKGNDLSTYNLTAMSIYGTEDEVLSSDINETMDLLPPSAELVAIEGGNHAYFGNYGEQSGDGSATISREQQQNITTSLITASLESL